MRMTKTKAGSRPSDDDVPVWIAYLGFPVGVALVAYAFWKKDAEYPWYDPDRAKAFVWGVAIFAIAIDATLFGYLPVWGE